MQRGVLELTAEETVELIKNLDLKKYEGSPLYSKLSCFNQPTQNCRILLSSDEIETIIDEIGFIPEQTNPLLYSAIQKSTQLLSSMNS